MGWPWTVLFAAVCAHSVVRLRAAAARRACDGAEMLMSAGMAAMASPVGGPIPRAGWEAMFLLITGGAAAASVRGHDRPQWTQMAVSAAAMGYVLVAGAMPLSPIDGAHHGHRVVSTMDWLLAGYFAVVALWSVRKVLRANSSTSLLGARTIAGCEVITAAGAAVMLIC